MPLVSDKPGLYDRQAELMFRFVTKACTRDRDITMPLCCDDLIADITLALFALSRLRCL